MECRGIEIGAVWPDERVNLRIDSDLIEKAEIAQRTEDLAKQNRTEINSLL